LGLRTKVTRLPVEAEGRKEEAGMTWFYDDAKEL